MNIVNEIFFTKWCNDHGLKVSLRGGLYFDGSSESYDFLIKRPDSMRRAMSLSLSTLPWESFPGALIWISEIGIWGDVDEGTGANVMENMIRGHGASVEFDSDQGYIFDEKELFGARAFWLQPFLFGWNAFMIPSNGEYFVYASHDEVCCVVSKTKQIHEMLMEKLSSWSPDQNDPYYRKLLSAD